MSSPLQRIKRRRIGRILLVAGAVVAVLIVGGYAAIRYVEESRARWRDENEARAKHVLISIHYAQRTAHDETGCYASPPDLLRDGRMTGDSGANGIIGRGYEFIFLSNSCDEYRVFAFPDIGSGSQRSGDRTFVVTNNGVLATLIGTEPQQTEWLP